MFPKLGITPAQSYAQRSVTQRKRDARLERRANALPSISSHVTGVIAYPPLLNRRLQVRFLSHLPRPTQDSSLLHARHFYRPIAPKPSWQQFRQQSGVPRPISIAYSAGCC